MIYITSRRVLTRRDLELCLNISMNRTEIIEQNRHLSRLVQKPSTKAYLQLEFLCCKNEVHHSSKISPMRFLILSSVEHCFHSPISLFHHRQFSFTCPFHHSFYVLKHKIIWLCVAFGDWPNVYLTCGIYFFVNVNVYKFIQKCKLWLCSFNLFLYFKCMSKFN